MFTQAGQVMVILGEVKFAEPKFAKGPNDFDVCIHCTHATDTAQADWWRGEFSANYGKGNFATMTQAQITMATLRKCGFEGDDLTTLEEQIAHRQVPAMIKAREYEGKTYFDIQYIGASAGGNAPAADKVLGNDALKARMAALFGNAADAAQETAAEPEPQAQAAKPAHAPAAAKPKADPFAGAPKPSPFGPRPATTTPNGSGKKTPFG